MKVIGIQEKSGMYQGHEYHNFILHCTKEESGSLGLVTELVKIKAFDVNTVFDRCMGSVDWNNLIGKEIKYFCDKYGKVIDIRVLGSPKVNGVDK